MTTQDQKAKKIETAEKAHGDVLAKLTKARAKLADVERVYAEDKAAAQAKIAALEPEARTAEEYVTWVKAMPVSGTGSGELGAPAPAAEGE